MERDQLVSSSSSVVWSAICARQFFSRIQFLKWDLWLKSAKYNFCHTAGTVCKILRLDFLSRGDKNILVELLEHKLDAGSVKKKNSR